jgi:hypothetical protein
MSNAYFNIGSNNLKNIKQAGINLNGFKYSNSFQNYDT